MCQDKYRKGVERVEARHCRQSNRKRSFFNEINDHQQSWGYEAGPSKGPGPRSAGGR
jgi:hypothetical protein